MNVFSLFPCWHGLALSSIQHRLLRLMFRRLSSLFLGVTHGGEGKKKRLKKRRQGRFRAYTQESQWEKTLKIGTHTFGRQHQKSSPSLHFMYVCLSCRCYAPYVYMNLSLKLITSFYFSFVNSSFCFLFPSEELLIRYKGSLREG